MEFNLEGKKVTLNGGRGLFINAHYKVVLTQKQRERLWLSTKHTKSEISESINLKKIHVSNKLPCQELFSRGNQKVNLKERSRKVKGNIQAF